MTGSFGGRYGPDGAGGGGGGGPPSEGAGGGGVQSPGAIQSESSLMMREGYRRRVRDEPRAQEFWNTSRAFGVVCMALALSTMRVAITGASGLIGSALRDRLGRQGHDVVPLVRRPATRGEITWDPELGTLDPADLAGVDAVVNLAGAGIAGHRWTDSYKRQILESRTRATRLISEAMASADNGPRVLLSGSGVDFYGAQDDEAVDESSPAGTGFLAEVCTAWEASTAAAEAAGVRVAHLRTSMVLSARGGALRKMLPLFKLGLGGRTGSGKQWVSWISIDDETGAIEHLLNSDASGPVNLASPNPVTNADFARTLGHVLKRPAIVPLPPFAPKLVLGRELVDTLLVEGKRVMPRVLEVDGYVFAHPTLERALRAVLDR